MNLVNDLSQDDKYQLGLTFLIAKDCDYQDETISAGDDMLHEIYYNIGQVEVQDQIDVTKQLVSLYPFIDKSRVAIWGWSYGGFVTASVLARDADQSNIFQCGISVAPVTNWIYYDSIYSER